jgi:uncharacterized integral membrane protein
MICIRIAKLIPLLAILVCLLSGTADASTRGYETDWNAPGGLLILLGLIVVFAIFCFAYLLMDRMLQGRVDRLRKNNDIEGLIRALRSSWLGPKAARALGETGDPGAVEPLASALGDGREYIRKAAAGALGKLGDPRAIEPLSAALNDRYASVRDCARQSLERIKRRRGQGSSTA